MGTRTSPIFGPDDVGCWIDSAFGLEHHVAKLQEMVGMVPGDHESLLKDLGSGDIGVLFEASEDVIELLGDHTAGGLVWTWHGGDLLLVPEDQED